MGSVLERGCCPLFGVIKGFCKRLEVSLGTKILISQKANSQKRCLLELPADSAAIRDVLEQIELPHDSREYILRPIWVRYSFSFFEKLIETDTLLSLAELNHFAEITAPLDLCDLHKLDAIVAHRGNYDISTIINAAANMDRYSF